MEDTLLAAMKSGDRDLGLLDLDPDQYFGSIAFRKALSTDRLWNGPKQDALTRYIPEDSFDWDYMFGDGKFSLTAENEADRLRGL